MTMVKRLFSVLALLALAACGGGGGDPGTPAVGGDNPVSKVSDVVLVLSASTIVDTGAETVTATATALDANRNAVADVPLTLSVNANAVAAPSGTRTDARGELSATIGIGSDRSNRDITVTATVGNLTRTATLKVITVSGTNAASDIVLVLSKSTIASSGASTVTATVIALDAKRNALADVAVSIAVDNGAVLTTASRLTNSGGIVTGTIGIGSDRSIRDINVTATSGTITRSTVLKVVVDPGSVTPEIADLILTLSAPSLTNGGSTTITATATAVDANRNVVGGVPVTFAVDASAVAQVSGTSTNSQGVVSAVVGIGADRSNRVITVSATAGTLVRSASFTVTGAKLTSSAAPRVVAGSSGNVIEYTLVDFNSIPMAGVEVKVETEPKDVVPTVTGKTDLNGKFRYVYKAPGSQTLAFVARAAGDTRSDPVVVSQSISSVPDAEGDILSASVAVTPSVVTINASGSRANLAEVRALFVGADNKPISNVRVRFDLDGNRTNSDGVVEWVGTYAYSDANGIARATFVPGQRSSPTDGVTVRACYDAKDFSVPAQPTMIDSCGAATRFARTTLTVSSEALAVSIRTNELIKEGTDTLTYIKEFVVMVVDAAGIAKSDVKITPSIDLSRYYKGFYNRVNNRWVQNVSLGAEQVWAWGGSSWNQVVPTPEGVFQSCPNEDQNRNGVIENAPGRNEDLNGNGSLDPRKSDVAIKMVGSDKTDANGLAVLQIQYGKDAGSWIDFLITVTASGVFGTEGRATFPGTLPVPFPAIAAESAPAFVVSPYGTGSSCDRP
jgi:hypothetical protein